MSAGAAYIGSMHSSFDSLRVARGVCMKDDCDCTGYDGSSSGGYRCGLCNCAPLSHEKLFLGQGPCTVFGCECIGFELQPGNKGSAVCDLCDHSEAEHGSFVPEQGAEERASAQGVAEADIDIGFQDADDTFQDALDRTMEEHGRASPSSSPGQRASPAPAPAPAPADRDSPNPEWLLHWHAYYDEVEGLEAVWHSLPEAKRFALDPCGCSVLHLAVLRNSQRVARFLTMDLEFPVEKVKNKGGFDAMVEAVHRRNRDMVRIIYIANTMRMKKLALEAKPKFIQQLLAMPDLAFKVQWKFESYLFGMLLKKFAPSDTYTIMKRGTKIRMDGSVMAIKDEDERQARVLEGNYKQWKNGSYTLLFDHKPDQDKVSFWEIDHEKKEMVDVLFTPEQMQDDIEEKVDFWMNQPLDKIEWDSDEFQFDDVKTMFGSKKTATVEGYHTEVCEASAMLTSTRHWKVNTQYNIQGGFSEYLAAAGSLVHSVDTVSSFKPSDLASLGKEDADKDDKKKDKGKEKKATARVWLTRECPLKVAEFLPFLELMGKQHPKWGKVETFMRKFIDNGTFPVRTQIPLMFTVRLLMTIQDVKRGPGVTDSKPDSWFDAPTDYRVVTHQEKHEENKKNLEATWAQQRKSRKHYLKAKGMSTD